MATNGLGFTDIHDFAGMPTDGSSPNELLQVGDMFYGTTYVGGTNGSGTVFAVNTNGSIYAILRSFTNSPDPQFPRSGLIINGATLYGTSYLGGTNNGGTVFKIDTNGANFSVLHSFTNNPDGSAPFGRLLLNGATLYGTSSAGGSNNLGTIFKLSTNGAGYSVIYHFSNAPAATTPYSGLSIAGNTLYGTSTSGGIGNAGTIYQLNTNGTGFAIIHSFTNGEGYSLQGPLLMNNNLIYGTTLSQGAGGDGTVFQVNTNGASFAVVQNFTNALNGANPKGQLSLNAGTLYGIANAGGPTGAGTVFSLLLSPLISSQPQTLTVTNGGLASFNVTAVDGGAVSYQWYLNTTTVLGGQTGATLNLSGVSPGSAGNYSVVVSDNAGSVTSSPALLTVLTVPVITTQPQNTNVTSGSPAIFAVNATTQSGTLSYQWYFNTNTLLVGQTGNSYTIPAVTNINAGAYTVAVANNIGSVTSSPAVLTVSPPAPPSIITQPQSLTVTNGNPTLFSVTATNGTLTYQWYFNTNNLIAGQTNSNYTIPLTLTNNAGAYTVAIANGFGAVTSSPALLTVSLNSKPIITGQPLDLIVTNGDAANFTVIASGQSTLQYQWYTNAVNTSIGVPISGRNSSVFGAFTVITNYHYYFTAVVTNSLGKSTSNPALLTIVNGPLIISNPQPATVFVGNPASFAVTALGVGLHYQWYSNSVLTAIGTGLATQTNTAYSLTGITNSNGSYYTVVVTNTLGKSTSSPALLTVSSLPYITLQPVNTTLSNGVSSITFTSTAAGPGPLVYQWLYQTNLLVGGATNTTLILSNSSPPGYYSMAVTNNFGSVTSSLALFTILTLPVPTITLQPLSATITNGSSITFTSAATGTGTLGYQWLYQTNLLIAGATATSLTFTNANQPGAYSMKVTNSFGAATSSPAVLTVVGRPILLSSAFNPASGSFTFNYVDLAGSTNRLWATTNLANAGAWQAIATNIMVTNGTWQFTDTNTARTNAIRLYRFSTP